MCKIYPLQGQGPLLADSNIDSLILGVVAPETLYTLMLLLESVLSLSNVLRPNVPKGRTWQHSSLLVASFATSTSSNPPSFSSLPHDPDLTWPGHGGYVGELHLSGSLRTVAKCERFPFKWADDFSVFSWEVVERFLGTEKT